MTPVNKPLISKWWCYQAHRPELYAAISNQERVLVISKVCGYLAFAFLPPGMIYSQKLIVFPLSSFISFGILQSSVHKVWVDFSGGIMGRGYSYTSSDCFETFPPPRCVWSGEYLYRDENSPSLAEASKALYLHRASLLSERKIGLTELYSLFHDPSIGDRDIQALRSNHSRLDDEVINCYGWEDLDLRPGFYVTYVGSDEASEAFDTPSVEREIYFDSASAVDAMHKYSSIDGVKWQYGLCFATRQKLLERLLALNNRYASDENRQSPSGSRATHPKNRLSVDEEFSSQTSFF